MIGLSNNRGYRRAVAACVMQVRADGIASNALWPRTLIATAAVQSFQSTKNVAKAQRPY